MLKVKTLNSVYLCVYIWLAVHTIMISNAQKL